MSSESVNISSEGLKVLIGKFVAAFSGLIGIIVYANILGTSGLGLYYLSHAIATIASMPASGLGIAAEKKGSEEKKNISKYNSISLFVTVAYIIFLSILTIFLYENIRYVRVNTPRDTIVYLTVILFFLFSLFRLLSRFYSGFGEPGKSVLVDAYRGIIETTLQISFLVFYGLDVEGLLIGTAISLLLGIIYLLLLTPTTFSKPDKKSIKDILEFSKWSIPTRTINEIYYRIDSVIIGLLLSPSAVGIYESAMKIVTPSKYVAYAIKRPLLVRVSQDLSNQKSVNHLLDDLVPYASILSIPLIAGGIFVSQDLLSVLYGSEFSEGWLIIVGGAVYFTIHTHSNVLSEFLHGFNSPKPVTKSVFIGSIVRTILSCVFIYLVGLNGILISIIIAEIVRFKLLNISIKRECYRKYIPKKIITQLKSGSIMGIIVLLLSLTGSFSNTIYLGFTISLGGIVYGLLLVYYDSFIKENIRKYVSSI